MKSFFSPFSLGPGLITVAVATHTGVIMMRWDRLHTREAELCFEFENHSPTIAHEEPKKSTDKKQTARESETGTERQRERDRARERRTETE